MAIMAEQILRKARKKPARAPVTSAQHAQHPVASTGIARAVTRRVRSHLRLGVCKGWAPRKLALRWWISTWAEPQGSCAGILHPKFMTPITCVLSALICHSEANEPPCLGPYDLRDLGCTHIQAHDSIYCHTRLPVLLCSHAHSQQEDYAGKAAIMDTLLPREVALPLRSLSQQGVLANL